MTDENASNRRGYQKLNDWLGRSYDRSVFRRTIILLGFAGPAFLANLATQYFAAALLPSDDFGVFYLANTLVYILFSASFIVSLFLTRHLITVEQETGDAAILTALRGFERLIIRWGAVAALAAIPVLLIVAKRIGVSSWVVIVMVVIDTYTSYIADLGRVHLLSTRRTFALGAYTLTWTSLRTVCCTLAILVAGTVWSGLVGGAVSNLLVYGAARIFIASDISKATARSVAPTPPSARAIFPLLIGYSLTIAVSQLDVVVGYFILEKTALSIYSASSVFPKAVLVATMPLLQMLFAMMVYEDRLQQGRWRIPVKSGTVIFMLTSCGVAFFWISAPWLCGGAWGLNYCESNFLDRILLSVVPFAMVRFLVLVQVSRGRDYAAWWLAVPALVFLVAALSTDRTVDQLVGDMVGFSGLLLLYTICVFLLFERRPAAGST